MDLIITIDLVVLVVLVVLLAAVVVLAVWWAYRYGARVAPTWRAALGKVPLGVLLFDRNGRRTFTNIAASAALQHMDSSALDQVRRGAAGGVQQTSVMRGRDGVVLQAQAAPLDGDAGVLITLRDIAQQQRAEANYRQFIHTLSHELLTPLTAIQGHLAHIAASDRHDAATWRHSLQVTRDETERLTRLTSNLLILSRLESGQPLQRRPTNLEALAEEVVLQLLPHADARQITLDLHAVPRLPRPAVDRDAWKQVLFNLIENGIKYGNDGGTVTTSLRHTDVALVIDVQDNGRGIAPDDLPHVFTELFRAEAQRQISGSGLGLAIVRRIVEQHGGQISCTSELGRGTLFTITVPLAKNNVTEP